jgi:hypothetical protein
MLKHGLLAALVVLVAWPTVSAATSETGPTANVSLATCDDYQNQADAQRAKDTRDADGDGIYCETLPCPCLPPDPRAGGGAGDDPSKDEGGGGGGNEDGSCTRPRGVQRLVFDKDRYPNIQKHVRIALRQGWPRRLVVNRSGADARRDRLLEGYPTKEGQDRDEYPPAVGRGRGKGLERGRNPRGWKAHVRYVPSSENRSHGAVLGDKIEDFCNGTRFRYVFR